MSDQQSDQFRQLLRSFYVSEVWSGAPPASITHARNASETISALIRKASWKELTAMSNTAFSYVKEMNREVADWERLIRRDLDSGRNRHPNAPYYNSCAVDARQSALHVIDEIKAKKAERRSRTRHQ